MADRVLLVEDNEALRVGIRLALDEAGYAVQEASSGEEAIRKLETEPCHVVVTDIRLGDLSGVDILKKAKEVNSEIEVILMTAYATVETAVQALRLGAFDYIQKPFDMEQLQHRVRTALRMGRMRGELEFYQKTEYRNALGEDALVAKSSGMQEILSVIRKVAPTPTTVLITGETGTGKELLATLIHFGSPRAKGPYTTRRSIDISRIREYNVVVDELVTANDIAVTPPDFYSYFQEHPDEIPDGVHPNIIGYESMANLWFIALTQSKGHSTPTWE